MKCTENYRRSWEDVLQDSPLSEILDESLLNLMMIPTRSVPTTKLSSAEEWLWTSFDWCKVWLMVNYWWEAIISCLYLEIILYWLKLKNSMYAVCLYLIIFSITPIINGDLEDPNCSGLMLCYRSTLYMTRST